MLVVAFGLAACAEGKGGRNELPGDLEDPMTPGADNDSLPPPVPGAQGAGQWEYRTQSSRYRFTPGSTGASVLVENSAGSNAMTLIGSVASGGWKASDSDSGLKIDVMSAEGNCVGYQLIDPVAPEAELHAGVRLVQAGTGLSVDCMGPVTTCPPEQVRCQSGACVATPGECETPASSCAPGEVACVDGSCVPTGEVCDGFAQCALGEDEKDCGQQPPPPPNPGSSCAPEQLTCGGGECIAATNRCDGTAQCPDGSDEQGCGSNCEAEQFACGNGECVLGHYQCDGITDCSDSSDEQGMAACLDGGTVPCSAICDQFDDCLDGSDEVFCM